MVVFWIVMIVALLIIEGLTVNLVTLWFAIAAVPALILAAFEVSLIIQLVVFGIISLSLLIYTKPFVKKMQNGKTIKTNYENLINQKAVALEDFGMMKNGYVKINGVEWLATSENSICKDDIVTIKNVSGAKLRVEKI